MKNALLANLNWFERSGVMVPENGLWGVAERVAIVKGNKAIDQMKLSFPAWMDHGDYCIIEQRRADCNFEAAYMYLLASKVLNDKKYYDIAVNILDFLYFRSGLLDRGGRFVPGSWNWSHIKRVSTVWFDDESWCVYLQLEIAELFPELEARYDMRHWALLLGRELLGEGLSVLARRDNFTNGEWVSYKWLGWLERPHWGSLPVMALAKCSSVFNDRSFLEYVEKYHDYLAEAPESFIVSEQAYALIGEIVSYKCTGERKYLDAAANFGRLIVSKMDENGNIPAEHHEAPKGKHLVDTIYTLNWALVGMQMLAEEVSEFRAPFEKMLSLIVRIQDKSPEKQFNGCWRGMFDLIANDWGGGDCYEGGAGSIYTGWTNAPISFVIAKEIAGRA